MITAGVVGLGEWGPKLARNLLAHSQVSLKYLCDVNSQRLAPLAATYPQEIVKTTDYQDLLGDKELELLVIATPAKDHYNQVKAALQAGKDVLVEKPMALSTTEAKELISLAEKNQCILMVGHTFLYNAAVRKIKELITNGELGRVFFITGSRLSLGRVREDVNVMWNLAPHDISILLYILDEEPLTVIATGARYLQSRFEDVVFMVLEFPSGVLANLQLSWLNPTKIRQMTIIGNQKMLIYDDVSAEAKIVVYDKGVDITEDARVAASFGAFQLQLRRGDVFIPHIDFMEPLWVEIEHLVDCLAKRQPPLADGYNGLKVIRTLEAAQESLEQGGKKIILQ